MRQAVLPAQDPVRRVTSAVARRVRPRRLGDLRHEVEDGPGTAAVLPVAARVRPELVPGEEEGEAHLGHLDAAELDPPGGLALPGRRPAVPRR